MATGKLEQMALEAGESMGETLKAIRSARDHALTDGELLRNLQRHSAARSEATATSRALADVQAAVEALVKAEHGLAHAARAVMSGFRDGKE